MWKQVTHFRIYVQIYNRAFGNVNYLTKIAILTVAINGTYEFLVGFENRPFESAVLLFIALLSISAYTTGFGGLHRVSSVVSFAKASLGPALRQRANTFGGSHQYVARVRHLRKAMQCTRDVAVMEGEFQKISRMSAPIFMDFFLQKVISLLVADE